MRLRSRAFKDTAPRHTIKAPRGGWPSTDKVCVVDVGALRPLRYILPDDVANGRRGFAIFQNAFGRLGG